MGIWSKIRTPINTFLYESKPFILLAIGVYTLSAEEPNTILIACGLLLLLCSAVILRMRFRNRKGQGLEAVFYELQPFVYLGLALYVMFFKNSNKFAVGFALILLCCAGAILNWRYQNRR